MRHFSFFDRLCIVADSAMKTTLGIYDAEPRISPSKEIKATPAEHDSGSETEHNDEHAGLSSQEKDLSSRLMRINHTGEVCAQALYQGQALTAKLPHIRQEMEQAAKEEVDHLAWCSERLQELDSFESRLNPLWYAGSFAIGALAGIAGDKWSLGFVAETEHQVGKHLEEHLTKLPEHDHASRAILETMRQEELQHAQNAIDYGAAELPQPIRMGMQAVSKVMTKTVYYV